MRNKLLFVLLHNIRSLHNVGSMFRTADAFGVSKIYLTGYTGKPTEGKASKVSLGAEHSVPWEQSRQPSTVIQRLKKEYPSLQIVGLENNLPKGKKAVSLSKFKPQFPILLIVGNEVEGISRGLMNYCHKFIEIPQVGQKESLNVSVAFGVAVFFLCNK